MFVWPKVPKLFCPVQTFLWFEEEGVKGGSFGMAVRQLRFYSGFTYIIFAQAQSGCRLETAQPGRAVHSGFI